MNSDIPIIVFAYAFPHKKTYDFLNILNNKGFKNIIVIAAPWKEFKSNNATYKKESIFYDIKNLCHLLNFDFHICPHDNFQKIKDIQSKSSAELGIISGARILKSHVIELFNDGIVNFHTGKIPETSGLDSFYYSIKKNCQIGVTAHLIDERVDAGRFIFFEEIKIEVSNTIEDIKENIYKTQLLALNRYLCDYFQKESKFKEIERPYKNSPLSLAQKEHIIEGFDKWKKNQIYIQNQKT